MINVNGITKYYGDFCAVNNISFEIREGEITGLLGPNGAGKTTTLRMLTGYLVPDAGNIIVGGVSIADDLLSVKKMIGYLPESAPLYADMLVYDYLVYIARIRGVDEKKRVSETAGMCGLTEVMHKNIGELSKGYKQRLGLAHAMIHDPAILILDEPTSGLDPNQIVEIRRLIKEIGKKKTVILSTHILPEVEATCDRAIIINRGNIVADSTISELRNHTGEKTEIRIAVKGASFETVSAELKSISGVHKIVPVENTEGLTACMVSVSGSGDIRPDIFGHVTAKGWVMYEMTRQSHTLENVFSELTRGGDHE